MNAIFLSSSVPDRDPWRQHADPLAVREAVLALAAVWLPHGELVFGGHPAISPLVEHAARSLGYLDRVYIYQSREFEAIIPPAAMAIPNFRWTPAGASEAASLTQMRRDMIGSAGNPWTFEAAVFIGGMEGVEEEFQIIQAEHPRAALIPIGSTGAAAYQLWGRKVGLAAGNARDSLRDATRYRELFRRLLF
jgi:hypothetical protein